MVGNWITIFPWSSIYQSTKPSFNTLCTMIALETVKKPENIEKYWCGWDNSALQKLSRLEFILVGHGGQTGTKILETHVTDTTGQALYFFINADIL